MPNKAALLFYCQAFSSPSRDCREKPGEGTAKPLYLSLSDLHSCQRAMEVIAVEGILLPDQFIATGINIGEQVLGHQRRRLEERFKTAKFVENGDIYEYRSYTAETSQLFGSGRC